jgi:hypothetical protein
MNDKLGVIISCLYYRADTTANQCPSVCYYINYEAEFDVNSQRGGIGTLCDRDHGLSSGF